MTNRENALRILRFDHPERMTGGLPAHWVAYRGCNHEGYEGGGHDCPVGTRWTDIFGTEWHKDLPDVMAFPRGFPLTTPDKMADYPWPDPDDPRIYTAIYEGKQHYPGGDMFLTGSHRSTLWEKAYKLVGMDNLMVYFYEEPEFVRDVFHRIMDFQLGIARHYLAVGIEVASCGDDLGTQCAPLISPALVEEFMVPEYQRLFDLYKQHGVLMMFHSCGYIEPFLEMFIRLGVDVLNPIQATANDLQRIREITRGRMALEGGISTPLIMDGPPERITTEVRRCMWQLGREGGYFCGPDQGMPFPPKHIQALYDAIETYGRYPLEPID